MKSYLNKNLKNEELQSGFDPDIDGMETFMIESLESYPGTLKNFFADVPPNPAYNRESVENSNNDDSLNDLYQMMSEDESFDSYQESDDSISDEPSEEFIGNMKLSDIGKGKEDNIPPPIKYDLSDDEDNDIPGPIRHNLSDFSEKDENIPGPIKYKPGDYDDEDGLNDDLPEPIKYDLTDEEDVLPASFKNINLSNDSEVQDKPLSNDNDEEILRKLNEGIEENQDENLDSSLINENNREQSTDINENELEELPDYDEESMEDDKPPTDGFAQGEEELLDDLKLLLASDLEKSRNRKKSKKVEDKPVKENNNGKLGFFREIDESDNAEYIDISKIEAVHPSTFGLKKLEFVDSNDNSENTSQSYAQVGTKASKPVKKKEKPQKKVREKAPPKEKKKRKPINYKKILLRAALLLLLLSMGYSFYNVYMGWNTINLFAGKLYHSQMDKKEVKAAPKDTLSKKTVDEKPIITETKLDTIKPAETPKIDSTPAREIAHVQPAETKEIIPTKPAEIKPEKKIEKEPVKEIVSNKIDKTKPIKEKKKPKPEKIELTKIDPNINDIKPEPAVPVIVEKPEPAIVKAEQHGLFVVEVYSTPSQTDANEWLNLLKKKKVSDCFITKRLIRDKMIYRVRFGSYETKSEALEASRKLGFTSSWIDRIR